MFTLNPKAIPTLACLAVALFLGLLSIDSRAQTYQDAFDAYQTGDYARSVAALEALVDTGSAQAHTFLAIHYYHGYGVPRDIQRAAELYERAGDLGDGSGYVSLGALLNDGAELSHDAVRAQALFVRAADLGVEFAMLEAARGYITGRGTPIDYAKAAALLQRLLTTRNDPEAVELLAGLQVLGKGTEQRLRAAFRSYRRLADYYESQGDRDKARKMGVRADAVRGIMEDGLINPYRFLPPRYLPRRGDETMEEAQAKMEMAHNIALSARANELAIERRGGAPRCLSSSAPAAGVSVKEVDGELVIQSLQSDAPTVTIDRGLRIESFRIPVELPANEVNALRARVTEKTGHLVLVKPDGSLIGSGWRTDNQDLFFKLMAGEAIQRYRPPICSATMRAAMAGTDTCLPETRAMWEALESALQTGDLDGVTLEFWPEPGEVVYRRPLGFLSGSIYRSALSDWKDGTIKGEATLARCN